MIHDAIRLILSQLNRHLGAGDGEAVTLGNIGMVDSGGEGGGGVGAAAGFESGFGAAGSDFSGAAGGAAFSFG